MSEQTPVDPAVTGSGGPLLEEDPHALETTSDRAAAAGLGTLPGGAQVAAPLLAATQEEHEDLCRRCGMSCHFAVPVNGLAVVIDALRCRFLADSTDATGEKNGRYHCTVYDQRYAVAPWCHSAHGALQGGYLAQDCPYARGTAGYRGKVRLSPRLLGQVQPAIVAEILRVGVPIGADPERVLTFLAAATKASHQYQQSRDGTRYLFVAASSELAATTEAEAAAATDLRAPSSAVAAESTDAVTAGLPRRSAQLRIV
jgi:uncharacterized cysteine cluster protein YcgN (CxxCxxCC family)